MISKIEMMNLTTRDVASFGQDPALQYLVPEGGIDWGVASASHSTYSHPGQVGYSIAATAILPRDVIIEGYCHYVPTQDELQTSRGRLEELIESRIKIKKDKLNSLVNPLDRIRIIVGDYYIEGKPSSSVRYGTILQDNNEYFCKFLISIYCNNPMFIQDASVAVKLRSSEPHFHFPWILPRSGYVMSVTRAYRVLLIENVSSVAIGCLITLEAHDEITNPVVTNITTGETMRINKKMIAGEKIIINTTDGDARGIVGVVDGVEENYFRYWNFGNDWLQLPVGSSIIGYTIEEEDKSRLDITVTFYPMKYGLEGM